MGARRRGDLIDLDTIYDLATLVVFAGLVVLFLQRSAAAEASDHMYQYAPPAAGCAIADWVGNPAPKGLGLGWLAAAMLLAVIGYILYVLKPFDQTS